MEKLLSIKIPTYNCAIYLKKTIGSIAQQLKNTEQYIDIEIVDDCSNDYPEKIIEEYTSLNIMFYRQPSNVGAVKNFNTCLERSKGSYTLILHGDDFIEDGYIRDFIDSQAKQNYNFYVCSINIVNENGNKINEIKVARPSLRDFINSTPFQFAGVVFKTEVVKSLGGFDESLVHLNDRDLWLRLFVFSNENYFLCSRSLANYRVFDGNDTSKLVKSGQNIADLNRYYTKNISILELDESKIKSLLFVFFSKQFFQLKDFKSKFMNVQVLVHSIGYTSFLWLLIERVLNLSRSLLRSIRAKFSNFK
jgi:glycosyltransferase involved in cell wall biosynthesis